MSDRESNGRFARGNKISQGRQLGVRNQFTQIMQAMQEKNYTIGSALVEIASNNADEFSPELKAKADSKLVDLMAKVLPTEKPDEAETMTEAELDQRLKAALANPLATAGLKLVRDAEYSEFLEWKANGQI